MDNYNLTSSGIYIPKDYTIFSKQSEASLSQRKLEQMKKIAEIKSYYLRNPIKFMSEMLGADLFDAQAYAIQRSWLTPYCLWLCSRGFGKSSVVDLMIMSYGMLVNNYWTYIASGTGEQAITTFKTLENIANKNIESMTGLTGVFKQEICVNNAMGDGFVHSPSGHYYQLYDGSFTKTLNSNISRRRGARSNLVVFDECGWLDEEMMNVFGAFTIVNKNLRMGGNINAETIRTLPKDLNNKLFYISSASSIDTPFYKKYRDFSKQMLLGNPKYFVADINCDVVIRGTVGGKVYGAGLLTKETVDAELRSNREKALREYYNLFSTDGGTGAIIKRAWITRNSSIRCPVLCNPDGKRKYAFFYDPARTTDNAVILICEVCFNEEKGYYLEIVNLINFRDPKTKKPMTTPQQIEAIKQLLLDYNGGVDDYENIECLMIDAGRGGAGVNIADFLWEDWYDNKGNKHRGIIDKEYSADYVKAYPNAVNIVRLMEPGKYKSEMFESLIKRVEENCINFTDSYDNKGYLNIPIIDEKKKIICEAKVKAVLDKKKIPEELYQKKFEQAMSRMDYMQTKMCKLSFEEENSLKQIDLLKEELVNICRFPNKQTGKDSFKLPPNKDREVGAAQGLNDDRAWTLSASAFFLTEKRLQDGRTRKRVKTESKNFNFVRAPKKITQF